MYSLICSCIIAIRNRLLQTFCFSALCCSQVFAATMSFYVNGQFVRAYDPPAGPNESVSNVLLGRADYYSAPSTFLGGALDEVRIWNVVRTESQIAAGLSQGIDPNTPDLVGYWNFDENINDQNVLDSSPLGNNGTLGANAAIGADDPERIVSTAPISSAGNALLFDGIDDFVNIPHDSSLSLQAMTIEAWVFFPTGDFIEGTVISKGVEQGNYRIGVLGNNHLVNPASAYYAFQIPTGNVSVGAPIDPAFGQWVHLAATFNPVPVPAAVWLFGSGLLGLVGIARRKKFA